MYVGEVAGQPGFQTPSRGPGFRFACRHSSMVQLGCRPWNLSLVSVIILGFSNMFLTFLLLQSENCSRSGLSLVGLDFGRGPSRAKEIREEREDKRPANLGPAASPCPSAAAAAAVAASTSSGGGGGAGYDKPSSQDEQLSPLEGLDYTGSLSFDVRLGRWDSRRLYRMFDSVLTGTRFVELSESSRVCLATQSSLEKLHFLVQVAHQWTGPLSVGVYVAGDEEFELLQKYLEYMRRCYEPIRERLSLSLAVPKARPPRQQPRYYPLPDVLDCQKPEGTLAKLVAGLSSEQTSWRVRNVYPQNHMRNLARKNCQSEHVFLTDVDIVPSTNLSRVLEEFLAAPEQARCDKCAYVIPTYELDARVRFPQNKTELVRLAKKGLARPFHQKVFIHNQFATNFTRWMLDATPGHKTYENLKSGKAYVSHEVTNFEFLYEPFYVAKDVAPAHDERFMGYGYTRNTQKSSRQ